MVVCSAIIFLTAKVDEKCRSSRDILNVMNKILNNENNENPNLISVEV